MMFIVSHNVSNQSRVSGLSDIEELSRVSCCLPTYIKKGIAIAAFILGRCFERGHGIPKNHHQAIVMYKKVGLSICFFDRVIHSLL